jgi:two-component system OmpR family sensor kinase
VTSTRLPERRRRVGFPSISVRTRILVTVLIVTALCMLVTGTLFYLVQHERVDARIDRNLDQEVDEFEALASNGVDPNTGEAFTTVTDLMRVALQRNVADDNETFMALVGGEPRYYPRGNRPVRLEEEPAVLSLLARIPAGSQTIVRNVDTSVAPCASPWSRCRSKAATTPAPT